MLLTDPERRQGGVVVEGAVADQGDDRAVRRRCLHAERRPQSGPESAAAAREEAPGLQAVEEAVHVQAVRDGLVDHDRVRPEDVVQLVGDPTGVEGLPRRGQPLLAQRVPPLLVAHLPPLERGRPGARRDRLPHTLDQHGE